MVEEVARRLAEGERVTDEDVVAQHPELMPELADKLKALALIAEQLQEDSPPQQRFDPGDRIHRYVVERILGEGHFGTVFFQFYCTYYLATCIARPLTFGKIKHQPYVDHEAGLW